MRDQVFSGPDVPAALDAASRALGVPAAALRYVVLDAGSAGGRGLNPTPARVAVLLPGPAPAEGAGEASPADAATAVREVLRSLAAAAGVELDVTLEAREGALWVQIGGAGSEFFLDRDGVVLDAAEHLLQKVLAARGEERLVLECAGYRESRDAALVARARELAAAVRQDGRARQLPPLNAYERRVVHVALTDEPGVRTFSVGEGAARRLTIAPAGAEE